jgi:predicted phosphodiesterase
MKIAVFSDVHSNSFALEKAIEAIELESADEIVFLGDLLTYGCNVQDTINLLVDYSKKRKVHFIKGNHDQIYFDMQANKDFQYKPFPDFILEYVLYTCYQLKVNLHELFNWKESVVIENIIFSHANALGYGNWSYLDKDHEIIETARIISQKGYLGGVFGHTHRPKLSIYQDSDDIQDLPIIGNKSLIKPLLVKCFITNPGSVGQPRGMEPSVLFININHSDVELEVKTISYDVSRHCEHIESSTLSKTTKDKLISYYKN